MTDTKKTASAAVEKKPIAAPQDHKPAGRTKQQQAAEAKKQEKILSDFMSAGISFEPFTVDAGDGLEWKFIPDMMPGVVQSVRAGVTRLNAELRAENGDIEGAYEDLAVAIRSAFMPDAEQPAEFPRPNYGVNAVLWFAMTIIQGKTGFPTE